MKFPETHTLQDQLQIPYLIRYSRWDKTVPNNVLVTLDNIQINVGFVTLIMEDTSLRTYYVNQRMLASHGDG